MEIRLLFNIIFDLRIISLSMSSHLQKLLHFIQRYKQQMIKLLKQEYFALRKFCIYLSRILKQISNKDWIMYFSTSYYTSTLNLFRNFILDGNRVVKTYFYSSRTSVYAMLTNLFLCGSPSAVVSFGKVLLKNRLMLFTNNDKNLKLYLSDLKDQFCKIVEYEHAFILHDTLFSICFRFFFKPFKYF